LLAFFFLSLLRRLCIHSVTTGTMTAGAAVIAVAVFTAEPNNDICVVFSMTLGRFASSRLPSSPSSPVFFLLSSLTHFPSLPFPPRLYTLTMLSNLNRRGKDWPSGLAPTSGQTPGRNYDDGTGTRNMIGADAGLTEMSLRGVKVTSGKYVVAFDFLETRRTHLFSLFNLPFPTPPLHHLLQTLSPKQTETDLS